MRVTVALCLAASLLLLGSEPSRAEDYLEHGRGTTPVIVWKDQAGMEKGREAARNRQSVPSEVMPLIACIVPSGTRAEISRVQGGWAWNATVLEGEFKGCQGVVSPNDFKTAGERAASEYEKKRAGCRAKFEAWVTKQPPGLRATKFDVDRAIGQECSDLLSEQLQQEKQRAARETQRAARETQRTQVARADLSKARSAMESLRALQSVTQVGVNYQGYLTRFADAKIAFDRVVREMGDSKIRDALLEAMRYYKLAGNAWSGKFQGLSPLNYAQGDGCPALRRLASVRRDMSLDHARAEESVVSTIFSCASGKVAEADEMIAAAER